MLNLLRRSKKPKYNLAQDELKILQAIWLKNAPMSLEEIIGSCSSDYWPQIGTAQDWICQLLGAGLLQQLPDGKYDLGYRIREDSINKQKIHKLFAYNLPFSTPLQSKRLIFTEQELRAMAMFADDYKRQC